MDAHYIGFTFLWKMYKKCIPFLSGKFSKTVHQLKKSHYSSKTYLYPNIRIPLANWTICASILKWKKNFFLKFMPKKGGGIWFCQSQLFKVGRENVPSSLVLVKIELQTHTEHLSSCGSRFLVGFVLLNLQFSVN